MANLMVGCDIVAISRIERIFGLYGVNFLAKFLSENERKLVFSICENTLKCGTNLSENSNSSANSSINLNENLGANLSKPNFSTMAGFFAAKEAASKALGCGICETCGFLDIEIYKDSKNAPKLKFSPKITRNFQIKQSSLSIAHDGGFAIAVAVLQG